MGKRGLLAAVGVLAIAGIATVLSVGVASGASSAKVSLAKVQASCPSPYLKQAALTVNLSKFKQKPPWKIGASGSSLNFSSYLVYMNAEVKYAVSLDKRIGKLVETDANFNASKQVSDIESLIRQKVDVLLFWPTDSRAIAPALHKARQAGIPVIQVTNGFVENKDVNLYATVDLWKYYVVSATHLFNALGGKGDVAQLLTLPGTTEDTVQKAAVGCVLKSFSGIKIVDSQYGKYATQDSRNIADAWMQRFPNLDGILSVYGEPSTGVAQALEQAGRLGKVKIAPGNQNNGWLKVLKRHPELNLGGVDYPVTLGKTAIQVAAKLLSGQSYRRATFVGGFYIPKSQMLKPLQPGKSDSFWPNDVPPKFQPK